LAQAWQAARNWMFILGFRPDYRVENLLITIAVFATALLSIFVGANAATILLGAALLMAPLLVQYREYRRRLRRSIQFPLYVVLMSGAAAFFMPPLIIPALLNTLFVEDFTVFFKLDVVAIRRTIRVFLAPITRRSLVALTGTPVATAVASFIMTGNPLVFVYPLISYAMIVYSLVIVPPEYRAPQEGRRRSLLEEVSRRVSILFFLFSRVYMSPRMRTLGREAGMIGLDYDSFVRRMGGIFTLATYTGLAVSPLLYAFMGRLAYPALLGTAAFFLVLPYLVLYWRRMNRAGSLSRNLILIIVYLASMKAVAETFTNTMLNLKDNVRLARLFGMEGEAKLYHRIYLARGVESVAAREYADSIPEDYYRDTIRTMMDMEENEGVGAVFRMLVTRLRDFTGRYIDRVSSTFENIGGNVISVIILVQTALPILLFLSSPMLLPMAMLAGGILGAFLIFFIANAVLPDMPSEFVRAKPRYRGAAMVFALAAFFLTVVEYLLLPDLLAYLIVLNVPAAFWAALWYASKEDLELNSMFFDKFPDLLVLFSSSLAQHNAIDRAMVDLSQEKAFPSRLREEFARLARLFAYVNVQRLEYRGGYWYKFFLFLASLAAIYGTTPRELYKTIGNFMVEFKRLAGMVSTFGKAMLFMNFMALLIMTMEVTVALQFLRAMQEFNIGEAATALGVQSPLPTLSEEEIRFIETLSWVSLLVVAISNGIALAKINSLTVRDGKYVLAMFLLELLLIYVGVTTSFGISMSPGA